MARILITNNGNHSAEKWAMTTAEMVFPLEDAGIVGERLIAAQKFQTALAEALAGHHQTVMDDEKANLDADPAHFDTACNPHPYVDHVVADVVELAKGTPWEAHFAHKDVQAAVRDLVANHMHTVQHNERLWHPALHESEHGLRYKKMYVA